MSIADEYDLLDTIVIATELKVDNQHYFIGSYRYGNTRITKKLEYNNNCIVINKNIFNIDRKKLEPRDITLRISYVDGIIELPVFIKDNIVINIIPDKID